MNHLYPQNSLTALPQKTCSSNLTKWHAISELVSFKEPDLGHFILLDIMNSISSFNKYKNILFIFWLMVAMPMSELLCLNHL